MTTTPMVVNSKISIVASNEENPMKKTQRAEPDDVTEGSL